MSCYHDDIKFERCGMAVKPKNFELVTGQALNFAIVYSGPSGPINLSGYTASAVFSSPAGATLITLGETGATGPGIYKVAANGYLRIGLTEEDVAALQPGASYKVFVQNNSDSTDKPCLGRGVVKFV